MISVNFEDYAFTVPGSGRMSVRGQLRAGESWHLNGPSGIGKSTFLRSVAGLRPGSESGSLRLFGNEMVGQDIDRPLAMVFQGPQLFPHLSVRENLMIAFEKESQLRALSRDLKSERIRQMLTRLGLLDKLDDLASGLSGGEHQRVAIGRALLSQARLLLLDEPFSALDAQAVELVNDLLREHVKSLTATLLVVTHRREDFLISTAKAVEWSRGQTCLDFSF